MHRLALFVLATLCFAPLASLKAAEPVRDSSPAAEEIMRKAKERFSLVTRRCAPEEGEEIVVCGRRDTYRIPPDERPIDLRTEDRGVLLDRRRFECPPIAASCPSPGLTIMTVGSDGRTRFGEKKVQTR